MQKAVSRNILCWGLAALSLESQTFRHGVQDPDLRHTWRLGTGVGIRLVLLHQRNPVLETLLRGAAVSQPFC